MQIQNHQNHLRMNEALHALAWAQFFAIVRALTVFSMSSHAYTSYHRQIGHCVSSTQRLSTFELISSPIFRIAYMQMYCWHDCWALKSTILINNLWSDVRHLKSSWISIVARSRALSTHVSVDTQIIRMCVPNGTPHKDPCTRWAALKP